MRADPHPLGHRLDLSWDRPPAPVDAVVLVRREWTHPVAPDDGMVVARGAVTAAVDGGLRGETVYYYALFGSAAGVTGPDPIDRTSATTTARYDLAGLMYGLLPAVYRRFDADKEELRAFLDLPGSQLDQLYSAATTALSVLDLDRVDARLLPLLAQWIGWEVDRGAPVRAQRLQVRFAPDVYRSVGALPAAVATVNRVTGRSARIKEYVHNVATTNRPPRLNLWATVRDGGGTWGEPALLSTGAAPGGRVAHVRDDDGADLVLFHTTRRHGSDLWGKRGAGGEWEPSAPVVDRPGADLHPAAARQGDRLWLFWEALDPAAAAGRERRWRLWFRTRTGATWTDPAVLGPAGDGPARRNPAAVADGTGGLWLFWREWTGTGWAVRWDRHDGTAWQLGATPGTLPDDAGAQVAVEDDLVALAHPDPAAGRIWLFWARRTPIAGGQRRWEIALRVKRGLDPAVAADWSPVRVLPKAAAGDHDREPAPLLGAGGAVELFRATTAGGGWAVVSSTLDVTAGTWSAARPVVGGPAVHRAPLAVAGAAGETLLVHRSDASLALAADDPVVAGRVLDPRYAGSTTVRTGDPGAAARRGTFADTGTYTYDTGTAGARTAANRVSRDTVGVFLDVTAEQPDLARLEGVLPDFLPVSVRAVVQQP